MAAIALKLQEADRATAALQMKLASTRNAEAFASEVMTELIVVQESLEKSEALLKSEEAEVDVLRQEIDSLQKELAASRQELHELCQMQSRSDDNMAIAQASFP